MLDNEGLINMNKQYIFGIPVGRNTQDEERHIQKNKPYQLVLDLTSGIYSTERNVTMDRYYTSLPLAQAMDD